MAVVIRLENVSKKFSLERYRPRSWQEMLFSRVSKKHAAETGKVFWVLKNASFEIQQGETVGLIGPNGTGKSTLLKLLANIIRPTTGRIEINGRISALLEVGSGFHPDLTGRENIHLNGAILGLNKAEVERKLDEIIAFAELEQFIDMPVKHYSSGMYVRLGFAVAVHVQPTILLIDEVLAVGDAAFQRKCIERIDQLRQQGVTILFVSHSPELIGKICQRAIWLKEGQVTADGPVESVVKQYMWHAIEQSSITSKGTSEQQWGSGEVKIERVCLLDKNGAERATFVTGEPLIVELQYQAFQRIERPVFGLAIHRNDGMHVTGPNTRFAGLEIPWIEGRGIVRYKISSLPLLEGTYHISVSSHDWEDIKMFDYHDRRYSFRVLCMVGERYGAVSLNGAWSWDNFNIWKEP
jgi:lipopolysaccharide transport system ATP-binding protein